MTGTRSRMICGMIAVLFILAMEIHGVWAAEKVPRMTQEQLKEFLGKSDLIILDVRSSSDWGKGQTKIQGAVREDPGKPTKTWAEQYAKAKTIVLYCAWPNEGTSARVAQDMISMGFTKVYALQGGWNGWSKANFPVEAK